MKVSKTHWCPCNYLSSALSLNVICWNYLVIVALTDQLLTLGSKLPINKGLVFCYKQVCCPSLDDLGKQPPPFPTVLWCFCAHPAFPIFPAIFPTPPLLWCFEKVHSKVAVAPMWMNLPISTHIGTISLAPVPHDNHSPIPEIFKNSALDILLPHYNNLSGSLN